MVSELYTSKAVIYKVKKKENKSGCGYTMSDKVDFGPKKITRDRERVNTYDEIVNPPNSIAILNVYASNNQNM